MKKGDISGKKRKKKYKDISGKKGEKEYVDISGKKQYKEFVINPFSKNLSHYCFIAVETTSDPLDFFADIFQNSHYLFQLSEHPLEVVKNSISYSFQSFEIQDTLSEHSAFCLVNKSIEKEQYLLGKHKNSCYFLQLSLFLDNEEEITEQGREEDDWNAFKTHMEDTSVDFITSVDSMNKIDYFFLVEIQTYEILKPLFLKFPDMPFLNHQIINPKNINEIDSFLSLYYAHVDSLKAASRWGDCFEI